MVIVKSKEVPTIGEILDTISNKDCEGMDFVNGEPGIFLFTNVVPKSTKRGKIYYEAMVMDKDCREKVRIWSWAAEPPVSGCVALAHYEYSDEYGIGLKMTAYFNSNSTEYFSEHQDIGMKLLPMSDLWLSENIFEGLIDLINDSSLKLFLSQVFKDLLPEYRKTPAAVRHHHVRIGGLLEHSVNVAQIVEWLSNLHILGDMNKDIAIAGALLHDIGKLDTYKSDNYSFSMTHKGKMFDHIVLGIQRFQKLAEKYNLAPEFTDEIVHIIASHHGKKEWGSPIEPKTLEAIVVHHADVLEAQVDSFSNLKGIDEGWTEYTPMLGGSVYRGERI